jgi:hypothetical protein
VLPQFETEVPQGLQHRLDERFLLVADRAIEDQEQIDVGVEALCAAAVATNRANGE